MITRHHVIISLMCSIFAGFAIVPKDPFLMIIFSSGTCLGAILLDIQMKEPKKFCNLTLAWYFTRFTRTLCVPVMCSCYRLIGLGVEPCDKRLTHSVPGIAFSAGIIAALLCCITAGTGIHSLVPVTIMFFAGLFFGMCLHMAEDLCTRKGIAPLYPFSETRVSGSIRPCNTGDRRIRQFHGQHCSVLTGFIVLTAMGVIPGTLVPLAGIIGIAVCTGPMWYLSSLRLSDGNEARSRLPQGIPHASA